LVAYLDERRAEKAKAKSVMTQAPTKEASTASPTPAPVKKKRPLFEVTLFPK